MRSQFLIIVMLAVGVLCEKDYECKYGVNNDRFKCNEVGLYKKIQCRMNSCFCVSPLQGTIAFDTRTNSNTTIPKCGKCLDDVEKMFEKGVPENNTFVPTCDIVLGDYEPLQCDMTKDRCYCVNPKTGVAIKGTEKKLQFDSTMKCNGIEYFVKDGGLSIFRASAESRRSRFTRCKGDVDMGTTCGGNASAIQYFFDVDTQKCYPFKYNGCGGNKNRFNTRSDCTRRCMLMDHAPCALHSSPARRNDGFLFKCEDKANGPMSPENKPKISRKPINEPKLPKMNADGTCPAGYICQGGIFNSMCCDAKLDEYVNSQYSPKCPKGQSLYTSGDFNSAVLGKSCSHQFCPYNYKCYTNDLFAYCCK
ncbi:unnamed protein product [Caenorhabditis bovis]|uniref:BPTI/Kunitz inhibitor domain-containing protein n=1 Tax=Caenorhabditis bovis TaxID=2654633 RepID=A0A8S1EG44_9PELO|nr:unnamed protein product [Caenorhabditis bovis]